MSEIELQAVIRGEPKAVAGFIKEFGPVLQRVVRRRLMSGWRKYEEDVLQDIFSGLFANNVRVLRSWDPQKGRALKTFLQVFAEQRSIDWLRKLRRTSAEEPTETAELLRKAQAEQEEVREAPEWLEPLMARFRAECSPEDRRIIELSYVEDLSVREIAAMLDMSEDAVYQRRHRIKTKLLALRKQLSGAQGSGS